MDIPKVLNEAEKRMEKSLEMMRLEFNKIRTGRAHPSLLDPVQVDYYGTLTPLLQMATITVEGTRELAVVPWEKAMLPDIEKAIIAANLGLNPSTREGTAHINIPPLTEERRKDYVREAKKITEQTRISMRNIRRDANQSLKDMRKNSVISKDEEQAGYAQVDMLIADYDAHVNTEFKDKKRQLQEI